MRYQSFLAASSLEIRRSNAGGMKDNSLRFQLRAIAVSNNIGTGRARHSVRAVVCLAKFGAHGVTRPTIAHVPMLT